MFQQREERLRKTFCGFNADYPFPRVDYTERRNIMRKNVKCPRSKFIRICTRRASTERRKTKKNFFSVFMRTNLSAALPERIKTKKTYFCDFNADSPFPRVDYTERRKIMRKNVKCPRRRIN